MSGIQGLKREYFGTDGIRDVANLGNMTPEFALKLGRAFVFYLEGKGHRNINILIGRDTRRSGNMILTALIAGINSAGADVTDLNIIPTPGMSFILSKNKFTAGIIISASHNSAEYNGIKLFNSKGFKLTDKEELQVENMLNMDFAKKRPINNEIGVLVDGSNYIKEYLYMIQILLTKINRQNFKITIDAANGAASTFVKPIFNNWKDEIVFLADTPNGLNINAGVGVTHMGFLQREVLKNNSHLGIAYDGDTDRVLLCDSQGRVIDGDIMLWILARWLAQQNKLGAGVVATVMSNMALEDLLLKENIKVFRSNVGDRYVFETMQKTKSRLGGEQSGHMIIQDYVNTGDGLSAGILFIKAIEDLNEDISTLVDRFNRYPQLLTNVIVKDQKFIMTHPDLVKALEKSKKMLLGIGRVLLRPSGTEPLIRILIESKDEKLNASVTSLLIKSINQIEKVHV